MGAAEDVRTGPRGGRAPALVELVPIFAVSRNGVIGVAGGLPWRLPGDLRRFKAITTGHPVIMGRKTFVSLGRLLPDRHHIVITRDRSFAADGVEIVHSVDEAVRAAAARDDVAYVIGGAEVYRETIPLARRLHVTIVDRDFEGDTVLEPLDPEEWRATRVEDGVAAGDAPVRYVFLDLDRVDAPGAARPRGARSWAAFLDP